MRIDEIITIGTNTGVLSNPGIDSVRAITVNANARCFACEDTFTSTDHANAYAAFDAYPTLAGTKNYDHVACFQSRPHLTTAGTVTNAYGLVVSDPDGTGTLTNNYGIYVQSLAKGATLNYAIYTAGTAKCKFSGPVNMSGLPTSAAGLSAGDLWVDLTASNVIKVVV